MIHVAVILVAGGKGVRFGTTIPKQFLPLGDKPVARHSFDLFQQMPGVQEVIVVCSEFYQKFFPEGTKFASPGDRRQDSVWNGLLEVTSNPDYICVHDAARPLVRIRDIQLAFEHVQELDAVALGVRMKSTIKRCNHEGKVEETLPRENLWEVQTPQVIRTSLLRQAYAQNVADATRTDELSLVEAMGHPVYLVAGDYRNLKITTPEDVDLAQMWLSAP